MYPIVATNWAWDMWVISWVVAALWSAKTQRWATSWRQALHWLPTLVGFGLLFHAVLWFDERGGHWLTRPLWRAPPALDWAFFGVVVLGLVFTWWARLHLGRLWSVSVARKADHSVVDTGPYRLVRHPIYTGLIAAAFAYAAQIQTLEALAGALLIAGGFMIKARFEESFLRQELGAAAYDAYAARTPMLVPGWPRLG